MPELQRTSELIRFIAALFSNASIMAVLGIGGIAALVHIYDRDLPSHAELVNYQPAVMSRVYSGEGRVIAEYAEERRLFTPSDEIPDLVKQAFISAEDKNFYTHPGVDALGIVKAIGRFTLARAQGRSSRIAGASTITQQVMKNFLLGNERAVERKIKEMILAVRLDGALSKDQILELYLNEIFFGQNSYGIAAAAKTYFGKSLEEVTAPEAAYLASLPKAPSDLHPVRDRERAIERRNYVLEEMAQNGHLPRDEAEAGKTQPLETVVGQEIDDPVEKAAPDYFTAEVRRQMTEELGEDRLFKGGLTIRATIDPELQGIAAAALRRALEKFDRGKGVYRGPLKVIEAVSNGQTEGWHAALRETQAPRDVPGWVPAVVLETGSKTALIGLDALADDGETPVTGRLGLSDADWVKSVSRDGLDRGKPRQPSDLWTAGDVIMVSRGEGEGRWSLRQVPEVQGGFMAMDPHTGRVLAIQGGFSYEVSVFNRASQARRQPGSSFKPFVYAAALDAGYSPNTVVLDAPVVVRLADGPWRPKNSSGKFYGPAPLRLGIVQSRNLMTVRIAQQIGMDRVAEYAERFGVYKNMPHHLSYSLGAGETTLYDMVAAYAMFANGGKRVRPTVVDRIQDRHGNTLFRHDPRYCNGCIGGTVGEPQLFDTRRQIMNATTAWQLIEMMAGVVTQGTAASTIGNLGFPVAGKTGTTNDSRDAWFVGFSPNIAAGCYIGYDNPRPMGRGAYGGKLCGPVFKEFMLAAMESRPAGEFRTPHSTTVMVKIDLETGQRLPDDAVGAHVSVELFEAGTEPPVYGMVGEILGDQDLFGDALDGSVPYDYGSIDDDFPLEDNLPVEDTVEDIVVQPVAGNGTAAAVPKPRAPSGNIGLGTGGLY